MRISLNRRTFDYRLGTLKLNLLGFRNILVYRIIQFFRDSFIFWFTGGDTSLLFWVSDIAPRNNTVWVLPKEMRKKIRAAFERRRRIEEKVAALELKVSEQDSQLNNYCDIVSHNLRAPLVNMSMLVQFIEETTDAEEQKTLISKLSPVIENLNATFNGLVGSIQVKKDLEIKSEHINLNDCVNTTLESLAPEINSSMVIVNVDFDEAPTLYFPSKYLYNIFYNLVSNSLRYRSPNRRPEIILKSKKMDEGVLFSISDNSQGIDLVKHKKDLFKLGKVFHYHPDAKGFGLFITKTQVEAMNGKIWVESIPDEGSTFYIEFKNQKA